MELWTYIYANARGILALFSGQRPEPGSKRLEGPRTVYFTWPKEKNRARAWAERESAAGREVYHCAHLLTARRRIKWNAAPLLTLYVDGDGAKVPDGVPKPTAVVESSPGREQFYFRLTDPVSPQTGEHLNRRLALAIGADDSGWDLTQLLRPPGTCNYKYPDAPTVRLEEINDVRHDPHELNRLLPPAPGDWPEDGRHASRPTNIGPAPDLSRLSPRMQDLIRFGNHGDYPCRSTADMAACVAMFSADYTEAEVWAVMTDPANGISEKYHEKGRHGEQYLSLTIGKARGRADLSPLLRRKPSRSKARRVWRSTV